MKKHLGVIFLTVIFGLLISCQHNYDIISRAQDQDIVFKVNSNVLVECKWKIII